MDFRISSSFRSNIQGFTPKCGYGDTTATKRSDRMLAAGKMRLTFFRLKTDLMLDAWRLRRLRPDLRMK